jgi:hypothetical protein
MKTYGSGCIDSHFLDLGVQTGSGAHPGSYPVGTGGSFPGGGYSDRGVKLTTYLHPALRLRIREVICLMKNRDNFTDR